MSTEFLKYDTDDGRSSKIFQNEEDNSYYGELEKEFEQGIYFLLYISWRKETLINSFV